MKGHCFNVEIRLGALFVVFVGVKFRSVGDPE